MKLGIMGTGMIVQEALSVPDLPGIETCYLMGREHSAGRTEALCERYHLDGWFLSPEELLAADIDTVYVALPNQLHFRAAKQAIAAGKHVIIEKPVCASVSELDELAADARARNVFLLEAVTTPHQPAFRSLRERLPLLGEIRSVEFRFFQYSSRYDAFLEGKVAPAFDPACLGGALMDLNVYNLYAIADLFGEPAGASYEPHMQRGIDTSGTVRMEYGSFTAEAAAGKDRRGPVSSVLRGERGEIRIPVPMNGIDCYEICLFSGDGETADFRTGENRLLFEFREFDRILRENDRLRAEELLETSRIVTGLLERLRPY